MDGEACEGARQSGEGWVGRPLREEDGDLVFFPALALKKLEALRREGEASWKCDLKLLINIVISSATQN